MIKREENDKGGGKKKNWWGGKKINEEKGRKWMIKRKLITMGDRQIKCRNKIEEKQA